MPPARNPGRQRKPEGTRAPVTEASHRTRDLRDALRERRGQKSPQTTSSVDEVDNLPLAVRKRTAELDQEEETLRTKLRLIEIQRERLSLGPSSTAVQPYRNEGSLPSSSSSTEMTPALVGNFVPRSVSFP